MRNIVAEVVRTGIAHPITVNGRVACVIRPSNINVVQIVRTSAFGEVED